jgi:hypothetical protein
MLQLGPRQMTPATHKCGAMSLIGFEYDTEGSTIHRLPHSTACKSRSRVCPAPKTPSFIGFLLWFPSRDLNPGEQQSQPTRTTQFHSEIKIGYWISYRWHRALRGPTSSAGRGSWKGARCLSFFSHRAPSEARSVPPAEDPEKGRDVYISSALQETTTVVPPAEDPGRGREIYVFSHTERSPGPPRDDRFRRQ